MATATTASTAEQKESREQDKASKATIVVVDLDEPQSSVRVRRLRKGKGKLYNHVQRIIKDLVQDGTVKATAQAIVIVVREVPVPPWVYADDDDDDD
jgi:DNA-binding TFAR19-related protein (PDSD5 family)